MHLSLLRLNSRHPRVLQEINDRYEMHRTIMGAFPDVDQGGPGRVLFRVDGFVDSTGYSILVQSEKCPDWGKMRVPTDYFTEPPNHKELELVFSRGQVLRFRLLANPTVKIDGKRLGLIKEYDQIHWLERKSKESGFSTQQVLVTPKGFVSGSKNGRINLFAVQYDGVLSVTDPDLFMKTVNGGIGSAKGFGFGLLSLAKVD